jgi:hypothetical protein
LPFSTEPKATNHNLTCRAKMRLALLETRYHYFHAMPATPYRPDRSKPVSTPPFLIYSAKTHLPHLADRAVC